LQEEISDWCKEVDDLNLTMDNKTLIQD